MCIGNTHIYIIEFGYVAVYPYVYREHTAQNWSLKSQDGLSLCV